jgi:hypothetical protein
MSPVEKIDNGDNGFLSLSEFAGFHPMVRVSEEVRAYLVKGHDPDIVKRLPGGGFFCFSCFY